MFVSSVVFGFLVFQQTDALNTQRAIIRAQNQTNIINSRRVVDPPSSFDQFKTNLYVKFPTTLGIPETANGLFESYLGQSVWPPTARIKDQPGKTMGRQVGTKEFREFYIKNRGTVTADAQKRLDAMRASYSPTPDEVKKQGELIQKMENGVINQSIFYLPGGNEPIKFHKGRYNFKDANIKKEAIALETEMKSEMDKATARAELNTEAGKPYPPPNQATYKPKTEQDARQAFDEANYWHKLSLELKTVKESIRLELADNKQAKEKEWRAFPK